MATITLTYPDGQQQRIVDALCALNGYDPLIDGAKGAFAKQCVVNFVKQQVMIYEEQQRRLAMEAAVAPVVPTDIT